MIELLLALLLIPLALAFEGFRRRVIARMYNRAGPPLMQPFYDVIKLFGKENFKQKNGIFGLTPYLALVCSFVIILFVPYSIVHFDFDFLVLGYIFILQDIFYIFGAISSRSPFGMYASIRELMLMLGYQICFLIVLSLFFYNAGVSSFADYSFEFALLNIPLASLFLIFTGFVILRITPYDVMAAEAEISAGFFSEYSGRLLGILSISEFIKNFMVYVLIGFLLFGRAYSLIAVPFIMLFYAIMLASTPRFSTVATVKTFILLALLAFLDLFFLV